MARNDPPRFTVEQAAADLGIAHSTLARQVRDGRVPGAVKVGPIWLLTQAGIDHYRENSLGRPGLPSGTKLPRRKAGEVAAQPA